MLLGVPTLINSQRWQQFDTGMRARFNEEDITKSFFPTTLDVQLFPFFNLAVSYICYWLSIHITVRWKRMLLYSTMACGWSLKFSLPFCWLFRRKARFVGETGGRLREKNGFEKDLIKKWNWRKLYWDEMVVLGVFILVSTSWKKEGGWP